MNNWQTKTMAYVGIFVLLAGDAVRYSISWVGYAVAVIVFAGLTVAWIFRNKPWATIKQTPWPLTALLALMMVGSLWSNYGLVSFGVSIVQLLETAFAIMLAAAFSWRQLMTILGNTIRFILASSILFELYAAVIVRGPVPPIFKLYEGDKPPAPDYYWSRGNLFNGDRIQGILGNSNILAYVSMIGLVIFFTELSTRSVSKTVGILSVVGALGGILDGWSMTVNIALVAVLIAAVVSIAAEGKDKVTRHRYYRVAWWSVGLSALVVLAFRAQIFTLIGKSPDMTGRTTIWKAVLGLIDQRPLQGWGWISYWIPFLEPYEGLVVMHNVPFLQAHNAFLDIWLQLGILGLGLFVGLLGYTFVPLWRLAVRHTSPLYLWPILVFVGLVVQNLTESRLLIEIGWVLLVVFAVKVHDPEDSLEKAEPEPKRVRLLGRGLRRSQPRQRKDR
jgi:O-antigen ligase